MFKALFRGKVSNLPFLPFAGTAFVPMSAIARLPSGDDTADEARYYIIARSSLCPTIFFCACGKQ